MPRKRAPSDERLRAYNAKRSFPASPEPPAEDSEGAAESPRFVIQEHSARRLHWDLRLERDGVLESWALPKGLPLEPGVNHFAAFTEPHPLDYLHFHGQIPKGEYGAGTMTIWDSGTYEPLKWEPRKVEVALHGARVDARYALFATGAGEHPKDWMIHRMDPPADPRAETMPQHLVPMLARSGELPADEQRWAFEIKWDGVRAIVYSQPGELRIESRNLNDITSSYPEIARLSRALSSHSAVLDGELVAFDDRGKPSFAALQRRMHVASRTQAARLAERTPVTLMLFDLLWLDGHSLMALPYSERRELLERLQLSGASWQTPEHVVGDGRALLEASREQGLEGIVAKRLDSTYQPGARSRWWVKIKSVGRQEFVVGGWMPGKGRRRSTIGALLLGVHDRDGTLRYVGRVGTGFDERELARLARELAPLERASSPFTSGERPPREAVFSEPLLVVEVKFAHWTDAGSLRAPVYLGQREDKSAEDVVREDSTVGYPKRRASARAPGDGEPASLEGEPPRHGEVQPGREAPQASGEPLAIHGSAKSATTRVGGHELKLTNLDKALYPSAGLDKRRVIDYYASIAAVLLPHLSQRPLTVKRWPDGVEGKSFFQKQAPAHRPEWVRTVTLPSERTLKRTGKPIDYLLAEDEATLVWLANLAALELHVPLARAADMRVPTAVVFDLDPGAGAGILECARVALLLRGVFEGIGLRSLAKTSGSKGIQVYIPLNRDDVSYEQTKPFAKTVAELLEQSEPELVVSRMTRAKRAGKVLIDWSQNDAKKTTVCAYSLRATERPNVSTPVAWTEVQRALDDDDPQALSFEADAVLARVGESGDLLAPVLSLVQKLPR